jgi:hypothetical protein
VPQLASITSIGGDKSAERFSEFSYSIYVAESAPLTTSAPRLTEGLGVFLVFSITAKGPIKRLLGAAGN